MKRNQTRLLLLLPLFVSLSSCKKKTDNTCTVGPLKEASMLPIGTCIDMNKLPSNASYTKLAASEFGSITPENIFKASFIHPAQNVYDWRQADQLVDFCETHGQRLHGHTLIWHNQLPAWIQEFEGNSDEWEALFKDHIQTIATHFKGKVSGWDVINEAMNEDGTLRNTIWREKLGDSYIERAFEYAAAADPDALLFYNDYILELNPTKRKAVLSLLNNLRSRGIKVDGVGMQMHMNIYMPEITQVAEAMNDFADAGYKIHLSELDISLNFYTGIPDTSMPDNALLKKQAEVMSKILIQYYQVPENLRYGITLWGVTDKDSWLRSFYGRPEFPLLFNDLYEPKPVYHQLKKILCDIY